MPPHGPKRRSRPRSLQQRSRPWNRCCHNGFVVGFGCGLQEVSIHLASHDYHLVNHFPSFYQKSGHQKAQTFYDRPSKIDQISQAKGLKFSHWLSKFQGLRRSLARQRLQVDVAQPVHLLQERIRGVGEGLGGSADGVPGWDTGWRTGLCHLRLYNNPV